ncbi:pyridoxamine 5'-phosphate oxidase family protein [Alphaproteobacteria bacterium GH1-50]|uniref:Pyridoxamine 5'-phosphate oxidase family protein n=1 Tax=Kangsaoukella pontilimi TaxID=2691042 RepID=A0A7C9MB65_9RHOB|nr:pyridoxamine 5'-phosphate oxidase family protein [Kangsaoukella pontilimi]MXQ08533.1 pyridoxamine 5'-phosphate oxidase family protein [Kangsaoukella pontilimi]
MTPIDDIETLERLYDAASPNSLDKVATELTPAYRRWIEASRFVVLTTVGPEGTDASPRGDDGPVVAVADRRTLLLPDWRGNNRLDSLRNIVRDGRVSLMFMVPGSSNVVRVNGRAVLTADDGMTARFDRDGQRPKTVAVVSIEEMYFQCAKAVIRSALWSRGDESGGVPTAGDFIREFKQGFDADAYDREYPEYAKSILWS